MQVVRCNKCGWIGREELIGYSVLTDNEICPKCCETGGLMDMDRDSNFDEQELMRLWGLFGDVPINDQDQIEEEFLGFGVGEDRFEIWHWFDERFPGGVHQLMCRLEEDEKISPKAKSWKAKCAAVVSAYIDLCQHHFYNDSQIIDALTDVFDREELDGMGFGDFIKNYFDDAEE